jgi:hypothetical protein
MIRVDCRMMEKEIVDSNSKGVHWTTAHRERVNYVEIKTKRKQSYIYGNRK